MTDLDLDRLGDLWRQRPTLAEMEGLRRSAAAVQRKARFGLLLDNGAAIIVGAIVLLLVLASPTADTMVVGGGAIVILLLSQARTRRLRLEELKGLTGSTQEMLDQSIARARATLKRTRFQLLAIAPGFALGLGVAAITNRRSGDFYRRMFFESGVNLWIVTAAVLALAALAIGLGRSAAATRAELERLVALRNSFQAEGATAADDPDDEALA
ncbi:MAG: hypothetical protein ACXW2T_03310 [Allosphingosinicella sp.]